MYIHVSVLTTTINSDHPDCPFCWSSHNICVCLQL